MGKLKITIITTTFNAEKTITNTIKSVLYQNYKNIEYIIVDGKSNDRTVDIIKEYSYKFHHVIKILSEPDKGIYDAMNKGVDLSTGNWLYFLGSGDILYNILDRVSLYLKDKNTIYYGDVYMPKNHKVYDNEFTASKIIKKNICHQSIFYPKLVFEKYKYNIKYAILADYALNLECFASKEFKFKYINELIASYDDEYGMSKRRKDYIFEKEKEKYISKLIKEKHSKKIYLLYITYIKMKHLYKKLRKNNYEQESYK